MRRTSAAGLRREPANRASIAVRPAAATSRTEPSSNARRYRPSAVSTSTTLVESRRSTLTVKSSRNGGRVSIITGSALRRRLRPILAHQSDDDGRVPDQLLPLGRLHVRLPRDGARRALGHAVPFSVYQRVGFQGNGLSLRSVDARSRASQYVLLHGRCDVGVRARRPLRPVSRAAARSALSGDHGAAANLARRTGPCNRLFLLRRALQRGSCRLALRALRSA